MSYPASDFYHIRQQLLLINPYEMVFLLSAPAIILWSIVRRKNLRYYLLLGVVYVIVLYPTAIAAMSLHWDLISQWKADAAQHPAVVDGMLAGNGAKMLMLMLVGWVFVAAIYLFWLLVFSPAVYLCGRKRGWAQQYAGGVLPREDWLILLALRIVPGVVSEMFIVLGVLAALAAGPCFWVSLQSDAPPLTRPMFPMFFVVAASFLAIGLLAKGIERTWAARESRTTIMGSEPRYRRMSPSLKSALVVAGGSVAALMAFGWCVHMLVVPMVLALLLAGLSLLAGLVRSEGRTGICLWQRTTALAVIGALLCSFTTGHGSAYLANLHARAAVALTGDQDELQSWAVQVLASSRQSLLESHSLEWNVPMEQWSNQVRRLRPSRVTVDPVVFQGEGDALFLTFGGGLYESRIVVGRPNAGPIRDYEKHLGHWVRWGDSIYGLYRSSASQ